MSDETDLALRACSVVLTRNREEAIRLLESANLDRLPNGLLAELRDVANEPSKTWMSSIVHASYFMPAWVQFIGQRAVLVSPRLAYWVLRKTRLHHRWF